MSVKTNRKTGRSLACEGLGRGSVESGALATAEKSTCQSQLLTCVQTSRLRTTYVP
jgi:hypothetical protein